MLKKIKSIFVVEAESGSAKNIDNVSEATEVVEGTQTNPPSRSTDGYVPSAQTPEVSAQNRFLGILAQTLEKNNQPGFDYFEFRQALINLSKLEMDEATKYKSAYAAAQAMGVTPAVLMKSALNYQAILQEEGRKFAIAEQNQRTKVVEDRKNELNQITQEIQKKQDMISRLQAEVEQLTKSLEGKKAESNNLAIKLEQTKAEFEAAMGSIAGQIASDIERMNQYLK